MHVVYPRRLLARRRSKSPVLEGRECLRYEVVFGRLSRASVLFLNRSLGHHPCVAAHRRVRKVANYLSARPEMVRISWRPYLRCMSEMTCPLTIVGNIWQKMIVALFTAPAAQTRFDRQQKDMDCLRRQDSRAEDRLSHSHPVDSRFPRFRCHHQRLHGAECESVNG